MSDKMIDLLKAVACAVFVICVVVLLVVSTAYFIEQQEKKRNEYLKAQYSSGRQDALNGVPANANPNTFPEFRRAWLDGWIDANKKTSD